MNDYEEPKLKDSQPDCDFEQLYKENEILISDLKEKLDDLKQKYEVLQNENENLMDLKNQIDTIEQSKNQLQQEQLDFKNYVEDVNNKISKSKLEFEEYTKEREIELNQKENTLENLQKDIDLEKEHNIEVFKQNQEKLTELKKLELELINRQNDINETIRNLDDELSKKRITCEEELSKKRNDFQLEISNLKIEKISELDNEISAKRNKLLNQLSTEMEDERSKRINNISVELKNRMDIFESELQVKHQEIDSKLELLKKEKEEFQKQKSELDNQKLDVDSKEKLINYKEEQLQQKFNQFDSLLEDKIIEERKTFKSKLESLTIQLDSLREELREKTQNLDSLETFKISCNEDPSIMLKKITDLTTENNNLKNELSSRPSPELKNDYNILKNEYDKLQLKNNDLNTQLINHENELQDLNRIKFQSRTLEEEIERLNFELQNSQDRCKGYEERIRRLTTSEMQLSEREDRIREIKVGIIDNFPDQTLAIQPTNEIDWLENIRTQCKDYGIEFSERILYAFHTALKIADWSIITVLAGVSGTGKSELPRLYSAFGGINFINVPVQPNWDSQESMLGFFNSIDNRFDAQPLLRFLVQCTDAEQQYKNYMSIVLLDEMNLAHVEYYFADFLSKLETRRGLTKNDIPKKASVEVKLGAGIEPYRLELQRNVLWVGTMNQDETTKSLSDKVLDRGIVINFPRPTKLAERKEMGKLNKKTNPNMLEYKTWRGWVKSEISLSEEQSKQLFVYKKIVEDINDKLEKVGRALGHRVWQSIEYYIINYPTVIAELNNAEEQLTDDIKKAMHTAFEDQLVQKVMPKLRGIDTRGRGGEQLQEIKKILEENGFGSLLDDFNTACELGYGQFMWNSAKYLEKE